ncbi:MAG: hypothetical protein HC868_01875 [Sphingomonadales bacterium]|nr:hypothetical protein [Sphingomonadales bacterium]
MKGEETCARTKKETRVSGLQWTVFGSEAIVSFFISGVENKTITRKLFEDIDFNLSPLVAAVSIVIVVATVALMGLGQLVTQNYIGSGCWEERDGGLSGFGRHVIAEMNRLGIVVDLSHVAQGTASEAIAASKKPCAYTHVCPAGLFAHPRNKTDEQLREIVDHGGLVGVAAYAPFMRKGGESTVEDIVDLYAYMINVCGEDNIGIGTDFTQDQDQAFFDWIRKDKGSGRRMVPSNAVAPPVRGLETLAQYPAITRAMERRGWPERRVRAILGENWLRFLEQAW